MSFTSRIELDDMRLRFALHGLEQLGRDPSDAVLRPIGAALEATTLERFDTNVGPDGEAWTPSLRAKQQGGRTLVDQGHLRDSVHFELDGDRAVEIGSAHESAGAHQFGAVITAKGGGRLTFRLAGVGWRSPESVTLPARPFVGLSAEDADICVEIAEMAFVDALQ